MTRHETFCGLLAIVALAAVGIAVLEAGEPGVNATVDFSNLTRNWDGFGVNYVELAQNPGTAFRVSADGDFDELAGYWFYKQVSRAGQPGMSVVPVTTTSGSGVELVGFASNGTSHPDAFVVLNTAPWGSQPVRVRVLGNDSASFRAFLTTGDLEKKYADQGSLKVDNGWVTFDLPARSAMTLYAE